MALMRARYEATLAQETGAGPDSATQVPKPKWDRGTEHLYELHRCNRVVLRERCANHPTDVLIQSNYSRSNC